MQNPELVSPGFVLCTDRREISKRNPLDVDGKCPPVFSYVVAQICDNKSYRVGDTVVASGKGAEIRLRDNSTVYWMFDVNAIVGKVCP